LNPGNHYPGKYEGPKQRCVLCSYTHNPDDTAVYDRKVSLRCDECNVPLHMECFREFHTKKQPKSAFAPTDERLWPEKRPRCHHKSKK